MRPLPVSLARKHSITRHMDDIIAPTADHSACRRIG